MPPQTGNNPIRQNPMGSAMPQTPGAKPVGPIIGVIIIVLVLTLGGLYFYGDQLNRKNSAMTPEEIQNTPDDSTMKLQEQSGSDETASIEADLNATDLENLDKELQDIEGQL